MENSTADVIVIGAGAAGLVAALEIVLTGKTVIVIEAKERSGGRIKTAYTPDGLAIDLGPEFIHGNLPVTKQLLKKARIKTVTVGGKAWQYKQGELNRQKDFIEDYSLLAEKFKELKNDIPVASFLTTHLAGEKYSSLGSTLQNYVEGYYAADTANASTFALRDELQKGDEEQYRINGGYQTLFTYLEEECRAHGVQFIFSAPLQQLQWEKDNVKAVTEKETFKGTKALITVSLGVLQAGTIAFSPTLPDKLLAARQLGFGHAVKVNLVFGERFWNDETFTRGKDLHDFGFLFSEETLPTWWTHHPVQNNILVAWLGGPKAKELGLQAKDEIIKMALESLSRIFSLDVSLLLQNLQAAYFFNWSADPDIRGAYSYEVAGGDLHQKILSQPVEDTLYFAGEALYQGIASGTVEAA